MRPLTFSDDNDVEREWIRADPRIDAELGRWS
ncbi:hypothetical protein STSO111631_22355 [Stackebrandtia soli]